jgi:hypothetical protein
MKSLITLLLLLPSLGSCTLQDDYYSNDYYRQPPPPTARVNVPYNSFNTYHRRAAAPRNYHSHDNAEVAENGTTHGHQSESNTTIHQHGNNYDSQSHGHTYNGNNRNHGHD